MPAQTFSSHDVPTQDPLADQLIIMAKKLKHEKEILKLALDTILDDAVKRGIVEIEATDSRDLKLQYAYRLLVHDKKISPIPNDKISLPSIKHRLAMWMAHQLPDDDPLLK